jgi:hypothetical protein
VVAVAIVGAAGIGAVASYAGSQAQAGAAKKGIKTQQDMSAHTRADLSPFREAGAAALGPLDQLATGNAAQVNSQLSQLPGYQFTRTQGLKAVQNAAAARGLGTSGAALKGASTYATGLANQTYGDQFNRLLSLGQLGANAAATQGNIATQTGSNIASSYAGLGNAQAGGYAGIGNALSGGANAYAQYQLFNNLLNAGGGGGSVAPVAVTPSAFGTY